MAKHLQSEGVVLEIADEGIVHWNTNLIGEGGRREGEREGGGERGTGKGETYEKNV